MRQVVMTFRDADLREGSVVAVMPEEERGDARRIGLEGEHQHVEHDLNILRALPCGIA